MSAYFWKAIGTRVYSFSGYYDGNGCTISGLYTTSYSSYQGLFGYVEGKSKSAEIHDVGIIKSEIHGFQNVGGIAGYAVFVNITRCYNAGNVIGSDNHVGGIVGDFSYDISNTKITNCYNAGSVTATSQVGGIVGTAHNDLTNCYNTGSVTGDYQVGGVTGYANNDLTNCYNTGSVTGDDQVGGIAGGGELSSCVNCFNSGDISGSQRIGGVFGYIEHINCVNCYNTGSVIIRTAIGNIGGIAGIADFLNCTNCYNTGSVIASSATSGIGGIVGNIRIGGGHITNCYNMGSVDGPGGTNQVGGIAGYVCETNIENCYWGGECTLGEVVGGTYRGMVNSCGSCTTSEAKSLSWYQNSLKWYSEYPWDFEETWSIVEGMNDGYPILMPTLEIMQFTITYHPNGASGDEVVESKVGSESYTIRSNMFSRSGYNFTGWNTQANGSGQSYSAGSSYTDLANLDLYAQWSRITYTIKYDKNADDATGSMANTTKYYGTNVTLRWNGFSRTGYSFAGWATEKNGDMVYSNGATYKANANVTLYAKWTAHKYTVKFNGNGSTSGSMSNQTFTYGTAQKLTSNAFKKTGFTFSKWTRNADGTGTSYTNGQSVKNLTSTDGATINLYAQWKANNEAKYDSTGGYWYIENGKIPQTKVTNSTLISNLNKATTNGGNYYIAGQTLTAKVYSRKEYCKWNNNWYEVEPIRWRLDASSSQKDGYGTTTDTNAVLAEIVYVDQYSSSSIDAGEGYSSQSVTDFMRNGISTTYLVNFEVSTQVFGNGTKLYGTNVNKTANMFVSSQSEIEAVNGNLNITFSDLVEDMIKYYGGTNSYFTRDLGSNYNNITCINAVGKETQCFATNFRGVQFTVKFTEYGCVN